MAREKMITRTITTTNAKAMVLNVNTAQVETSDFIISGKVASTTDALNILRETRETDTEKIAACLSIEYVETLWGMPESVFLRYAQKLPPRGAQSESETETITETGE